MRSLLATILLLALLPGAAAAQDPATVTTGPAEAVAHNSVTLTGSVDPNGVAREYRFEVGTTTSYGLQTAGSTTGAGDEPQAVSAGISGLAPSTTYHYRLVADGVNGEDLTFTTTPAPARPNLDRYSVSERTATSARLRFRVDPNGSEARWYVEWGLSSRYGNRTAEVVQPAGWDPVGATVVLDALPAYDQIHWRVVAQNATGIRRSGRRTFMTLRAPTAVQLNMFPAAATWSGTIALTGVVQGGGVSGMNIQLQQSSFPFASDFHTVATARTNSHGVFQFPDRAVYLATRFRAVPVGTALVSAEQSVRVRPRVGIHRGRKSRRALRLTGGVNPGLANGRATLQRRTRSGWRNVRGAGLRFVSDLRSAYSFRVERRRSVALYRVRVTPRDGGAHVRGYSRSISVGKRR